MLLAFRDEVETALREALEELGHPEIDPAIERPPEDVEAVLASAAAFQLGDDPTAFAQDVAATIRLADSELIGGATVQGPYVNFEPSDAYRRRTLEAAVEEDYPVMPERDDSILLEHTSANPTGPLHVGRARNPIIGDAVARLLRAAGYDVTVEYYVNDMGRQVATIAWALDHLGESDVADAERDKPDHDVVRYYRRADEILDGDDDTAEHAEREIEELLQALERGDEAALDLVADAVDRCLEGQLATLDRLGASYDDFVRESTFVADGSVDEVAEALETSEHCFVEDDAHQLDLSDYGIDKELVFRRSDGTSLYTTRDVAYHLDKFERCDRAVDVLGEDHRLQARQLAAALDVLGETRRPETIFYSYVDLPEGSMSTRGGTVVNIDDLLDEAQHRAREEIESRAEDRDRDVADVEATARAVGIGAVRYDIVARQPEKPITFRWEDALDFDGQHAPSIQYVHARANGILDKADADPELDVDALSAPEEMALVEKIAAMSLVIDEAAEDLAPHKVATYARELADSFNAFYRECRVLVDDEATRRARLQLTAATKHAIARSLGLLGVEAPDAM